MQKKTTEETWLNLLRDAIDNKIKIAMNHKYVYKDYRLGSFLIHAKTRKNKDLFNKIESLGFIYKYHSKAPIDVMETYIHKLWNDENPIKGRYITRFNMFILPKKLIIAKELKDELNAVWKIKFGERRKWSKRPNHKQRVNIWKKVRYDETLNPDGKWNAGTARLTPIYYWVNKRRLSKDKMNEIAKFFNETEILELITEGFPIDNPYYKKPTYRRITREEKDKKANVN